MSVYCLIFLTNTDVDTFLWAYGDHHHRSRSGHHQLSHSGSSLRLYQTHCKDYLFWRTQIVSFLRGQGLLGYIDGEFLCPPVIVLVSPQSGSSTATATTSAPNPAYTGWIQQDQSILSLLILSLSDKVMYLAVGQNTTQEVWDSSTSALASSTRARCLSLLGQFQTLRQGNGSLAEYLGKAKMIVEALPSPEVRFPRTSRSSTSSGGFNRNSEQWQVP